MRKRVILAVVLVLALLASTGCSLIVKDEQVDLQTPIIEVAGKTITKGEVVAQTEYVHDYNAYMYSMYGLSYDRTSETAIASARNEAIDSLIRNAVINAKITEGGFDTFTDEEEAEIQAAVDEDYQIYADYVQMVALPDTELTGEELDAAVAEQMVALGFGTKEQLETSERLNRAEDKLREDTVKDVTVSEEELTAEYEARVATDKANYGDNPTVYDYGNAASGSTTIYYTPAGYRTVKHILVKFADEDQTAIDEAKSLLADKQSELTAAQNVLDAQGEEALEEAQALVTTLTDEVAALQADVDAKTEAAYAALQPTVDEINAKLAEGEAFESLIEAYNQDPGMKADGEGYLVSENSRNFVPEFRDASMALAAIGDVSEPVRSTYGIHIIQYAGDVAEGEIGLEAVREALSSELLSDKQSAAYSDAIEQWIKEADAKINTKPL